MKKEIDFLKAYKKTSEPSKNILQALKNGLILVTAIYCILLGGIFSWWSILKKEFQGIENQIDTKKAEIQQQKKKESLYVLLKNQLSSLSKIFSSKEENYSQILSLFFQISEGKVKISEIKISPEGEIHISGTATSAFNLASFLEDAVNSEQMKIFSKITLNSLLRQKEGAYNFSMTFIHEKN